MNLRPTLASRRGDELVAEVVASADATWFAGHFPEEPILPGVAFLALVEDALCSFWQDAEHPAVEVVGFQRVRFRERVAPGASLRLHVRRTEGERFRFSVEAGGVTVCTGQCTVLPHARQET
jgi:3-hydroxyacyl-[acyl-carrier-protein] dehydratase